MDTIHFRIDSETKRLAMRAAKRHQTDLTKLMRLRAEELAAEEREYEKQSHDRWLALEIEKALARSESGKAVFITHQESQDRIAQLRARLCGGEAL